MLSVEDILRPENVPYTDNVWTWAVAHMLHNGEDWQITTITDTAPIEIVFLSKGEPLTDYLISGNTVQNGTPTPSDPVDVQGVGKKTENLFDYVAYFSSTFIQYSEYFNYVEVQLTPNTTYAFSTDFIEGLTPGGTKETPFIVMNGSARPQTAVGGLGNKTTRTLITDSSGVVRVYKRILSNSQAEIPTLQDFQNGKWVMCNRGATPLPYEPYGFKLPLTIGGTEYPIYLGQVPTTRRVKKLVLDGTEMLHMYDRNGYVAINDGLQQTLAPYCDILPGTTLPSTESPDSVKQLMTNTGGISCAILFKVSTGFSSIDAFRAWIEENTPTVWYVLAEPETGIVNEPLMKIGEYADTISFAQASVTIPTIAGTNTLAVDTTVQPSEVSITGNIKEVQGT